jgi:hypothetical protein
MAGFIHLALVIGDDRQLPPYWPVKVRLAKIFLPRHYPHYTPVIVETNITKGRVMTRLFS